MDLRELSDHMDAFVTAKGWYDADSPKQQSLRNIAISLNLEAAEVLEHFQWTPELIDKDGLSGELADVMLYLLQLSRIAEIDLEQAVLTKLDKNYLREWKDSKTR